MAATVLVFRGVFESGFVRFDDYSYVVRNPVVRDGFTLDGIRAAFTSVVASNWYPLTWLSHMLDVELFGLAPAGHHAVNLLLHCVNALLLFGLLREATGASARSAVVAALFALHPTHVESVAWVSERKDVLSALLLLLCLLCYLRYARNGAFRAYAGAALLMFLGLMTKPILVIVPALLLLLDYWPLHRLQDAQSAWRLVREKIPLLAIALVFVGLTLFVQASGGALRAGSDISLPLRVANAIGSTGLYVLKTAWPTSLSVLYPHPNLPGGTPWPVWQLVGTAVALVIATALCLRRGGWATTGWLWFLVALAPVLGLIQAGDQGMADRYLYLSGIGLYIVLVWGVAEGMQKLAGPVVGRRLAGGAALIVLAVFAAVSHAQVGHWRDSISLFTHSLSVAPGSYTLHNNLGNALHDEERFDEAVEQYRLSIALHPDYPPAHGNLARVLARRGASVAAEKHVLRGQGVDLESSLGRLRVGGARYRAGDRVGAETDFAIAHERDANLAEPHRALGSYLVRRRDYMNAVIHLEEAARLDPGSLDAALLHAAALQGTQALAEAVAEYERATRLDPGSAAAHASLAQALAAAGDMEGAEQSAARARSLEPGAPEVEAILRARSL